MWTDTILKHEILFSILVEILQRALLNVAYHGQGGLDEVGVAGDQV